MDNQIRLNKFLAERLGVSRREADELIAKGKVSLDDETAKIGAKIDKTSKVCYNSKIIPFNTEYLYIAFHKPIGYVCSRRAQGSAPTLYELLPKSYQKLKTVGRLDKDSSGLILLTNDGDFAFQMTHPKFRKNKVYEVELSRPLEPLHQQMISDYGVMLDDGPSQFKVLRLTSAGDETGTDPTNSFTSAGDESGRGPQNVLRSKNFGEGEDSAGPAERYLVFLTEGRNRQIRRTFAALGYKVTKLHRISFGKYELGSLEPGKYDIIKP